MPTLTIQSDHDRLTGFRYFWAKRVKAFDPRVHCARCLVGPYLAQVSLRSPVNRTIDIPGEEGDILYLCGVSSPYRWRDNLHLAVRVKAGASARTNSHTGDWLAMLDCERIQFDHHAASERFPHLGKEFLSCRNFQFGAHHFRE